MALEFRKPPARRVVLLTTPGLFGSEIINRLAATEGIELVGVGLTNRLYKGKGMAAGVRTFVQRTGWRYVAYNALQCHVAWIWLRLTGRPKGLKAVTGRVRLLKDVNSRSTVRWLKSLEPDYVASYFFNQWIGPQVRAVPKVAAVNLHPSLLPALRGPDPVFRTIERGLKTSGHTIHEIADDIDAGRVLYQRPHEIPEGLSAFGLYLELIREGADLLGEWLAGRLPHRTPVATSSDTGDYEKFPTPDEVNRFIDAGHRLVRLREWRRALAQVR